MKYKCIIADDEPIAIRIIKKHLSHFDEFEVVAECSNAIEAMKAMRRQPVDLIFLDIEMPVLTGIEMLKTATLMPPVIFTTAHRNYAVDAFEVNALDYLLKPVSFDRFTKAINRFLEIQHPVTTGNQLPEEKEWILLKVDKKNIKVDFADILYIESLSDYVVVHLAGKKLITKERISQMDERLPRSIFLRVHRGFIINMKKVDALYGNTIETGGIKIPVGRNYKEIVLEKLSTS